MVFQNEKIFIARLLVDINIHAWSCTRIFGRGGRMVGSLVVVGMGTHIIIIMIIKISTLFLLNDDDWAMNAFEIDHTFYQWKSTFLIFCMI